MSSTNNELTATNSQQQQQQQEAPPQRSPKIKQLKKHMTYILSETTTNPMANEEAATANANASTTPNDSAAERHNYHMLNRTNSLLVSEELLNEVKHHTNNLVHNHNMSYNDNMNINDIATADDKYRCRDRDECLSGPHQHAANFVATHMSGQINNVDSPGGHLHRTREVENLFDLKDYTQEDDLISQGYEMIHDRRAHLKRTHEIENLNDIITQDD